MNLLICGVDEAGRGPLAGPVYAAAVILDPARRVNGLADSKVLTPEKRETLAARIKDRAIAWSVAWASVEEIDRLNIFRAAMLAMRRAVEGLAIAPQEAWIDGNHCPELPCPAKAFVDGDATHRMISAASILAKTERDAEMARLHERYPQYGFDRHKGYSTPEHLDRLGRLGPCEIHRRSFYPVGVFQKDLFAQAWGGMEEERRVRTHALYCEARRLSAAPGLTLADFDREQRRLRREYADVYTDAVSELLREARAQLRKP
jgi:ribonuclease HII